MKALFILSLIAVPLLSACERSSGQASQAREHENLPQVIVNGYVFDGTRAIFNTVKPGPFQMGPDEDLVDVMITKMPEVMASPVTQIIYKTVAELAKKRFPEKYGFYSPYYSDPSYFKGDTRPVEQDYAERCETWVKALNDLSDAEEPGLENIIVGHRKGMRYGAYLTEAQREYLMKKAKTEDGDTIDEMIKGNDIAKLKQYAAFDRSSNEGTMPVEQLKPLFVDGIPFWSLVGNLWEWCADAWIGLFPGGVDPLVPWSIDRPRVIRGGAWASDPSDLRSGRRYGAYERRRTTGCRIVRTGP